MHKVDEVDVQILTLLQAQGRMKRNRIAEEVGMSVPSVSDRMRKLEERGVITGYHAVVDAKRLHLDILAFIRITVDGSERYPEFVRNAITLEEVQEVHSITGDGTHILKVRTRNTASLERLLSTLQSWSGVQSTSTSIVLSTFKETRTVEPEPTMLPELNPAD